MNKILKRFWPLGAALVVAGFLWIGIAQGSQITNNGTYTTVSSTNGNFTNVTTTNFTATTITSTNAIFNLLTLFGYTPCSVLFAGPAGLVSQNNSKLCWDNTNFYLNVTGTVKTTNLQIATSTAASGKIWTATDSLGNGTWATSTGGSVASFNLNTGQSFVAGGYVGIAGDGASTVNVNITPWVVPVNGTLSNLRVFAYANTSALTHILIYKATAALSPTWTATALDATLATSTFSGSDTTHSVSVSAGDLIVGYSSQSWPANGAVINVMFVPN